MTIFTVFSFFAVLVTNFEFACFAPKQKYTGWTVSMETVQPVGLPYNKYIFRSLFDQPCFFHLHFSVSGVIFFSGIRCFSLRRFVLANTSGFRSERFTVVCSPVCQNLKIGCCFAANDVAQMCSAFHTCSLVARSARLFSFLIKPKVYFFSLS